MSNAFTADREKNITPKRKVFYVRYSDIWNIETNQEKMTRRKKQVDAKTYILPKRGHNTEREKND